MKSHQASEEGQEQMILNEGRDTNSLAVSDQTANALSVTVDSATLSQPGFIAIHSDANGAPGNDIAASGLLTTGTHADVAITASLVNGQTYWAMLRSDDGNRVFSEANDPTLVDALGKAIMVKFTVQGGVLGAEVDKG